MTDTRAAAVWRLAPNGAGLTRLPQLFEFANGIAISPDGRLLYVSTFPDGITVLDLKTRQTAPISRPADLCLASIDGLYFHEGSLIAIQNGFMNPRVVGWFCHATCAESKSVTFSSAAIRCSTASRQA